MKHNFLIGLNTVYADLVDNLDVGGLSQVQNSNVSNWKLGVVNWSQAGQPYLTLGYVKPGIWAPFA